MPERWGLQGVSSVELRQMYLDWHLLPCLRELVRETPGVTDVLVCVAQFYNDDANDEVHLRLLCMDEPWDGTWPPRPPMPIVEHTREISGDWWHYPDGDLSSWMDTPGFRQEVLQEWAVQAMWRLLGAEQRPWRPALGYMSPTPAFASFCKPGATQGQKVADAFTPILHITLPGWELRWVGEQRQPEVEDQFLCNTVRFPQDRVEAGPLERIPLRALEVVPQVEERVRELLGAVLAFTERERAGGVGEEQVVADFREWASDVHWDNGNHHF